MDNDILIPIIVTAVTAMAVGAIYVLYWLVTDGQPQDSDAAALLAGDDESAETESAESEPEANAGAAADARH
jgi:nitrogen fixation-related uncharacterized protein